MIDQGRAEIGWIYAKAEESILFDMQKYLREKNRSERCIYFRLEDLSMKDKRILGVLLSKNSISAEHVRIPKYITNNAVQRKPENLSLIRGLCEENGILLLNPYNRFNQKLLMTRLSGYNEITSYLEYSLSGRQEEYSVDRQKKRIYLLNEPALLKKDNIPIEFSVYVNKNKEGKWTISGKYVQNKIFGDSSIWKNRILSVKEGVFGCFPTVKETELVQLDIAAIAISQKLELLYANRSEFTLIFVITTDMQPELIRVGGICEKLYRMPTMLRKNMIENRLDFLISLYKKQKNDPIIL